ncbi:MAG: hypothetical protein P8J47_00620 [Bacteroidales bacterium]|jgi:hypothetical protein|nr:hypothetical protein [Bacteroidales bacterium]
MYLRIGNILTIFFIASAVSNGFLYSQETIGSRSAAMGRSSVAISDFWSITNNQSGIANFNKPAVGIYYEPRFLISEISIKSMAGFIPIKHFVVGASYEHFGYEIYNRQKIGLAIARCFGEHFSFGLQLDYITTNIGNNYGSNNSITFEAGVQSAISKTIKIGAWVYNPINMFLSKQNKERLITIIRLGMSWQLSNDLLSVLEIEKNTHFNHIIIKTGIEYNIREHYFFRMGFSTHKEIFSFGIGITFAKFSFSMSSVMHESMGFYPQTSLVFNPWN